MLRGFVFLSILLFLSACKVDQDELKALNNIEKNSAKTSTKLSSDQKYDLKKDEINKEVKIAKINADSTLEITKINAQNSIEKTKIEKEILLFQKEKQVEVEREKVELYKILIAVFALIIFVGLTIMYFINKRNNQTKLDMQMQEHHNQRVDKILDIVSSGNVSKNVEKGLLEVLKHANSSLKAIEDKSSKLKRLIFKD